VGRAAVVCQAGGMKLLLTNDDGIDAPGLQALLDAAAQVGSLSGCSHPRPHPPQQPRPP
jgi:hypothetical protein